MGEDGPTHQPVEQLATLRAMPGMITLRPADANEVVEAWKVIMQLRHEPASLVLTRQALPTLDRTKYAAASGVAKGAYVLADAADGKPDVILMASGSEVSLCVQAYEQLKAEGIKARVVSMPSWELFEKQPAEYRESVLPQAVVARVSVEQAVTFGWCRYVGSTGHSIGMHTFGARPRSRNCRRNSASPPTKSSPPPRNKSPWRRGENDISLRKLPGPGGAREPTDVSPFQGFGARFRSCQGLTSWLITAALRGLTSTSDSAQHE